MPITMYRGAIVKQHGRFQLHETYMRDTARSDQPERTNRYHITLAGEAGSLTELCSVSTISVDTNDPAAVLAHILTWVRGQQIVIGLIEQQLRETDDEEVMRGLHRRLEALQPRAEAVFRALRELHVKLQ